MGRKSVSEEPERSHRLSLAELAAHDDACSDAMIDNAFFKSQIRKNRAKYTPLRGIKGEEIPQILLHKIIVAKDPIGAEKSLLQVQGLKRYRGGLKSKVEQENFLNHLRKYIYMYMTDCPWEVSTTNRYTITTYEAAVTARQRIKQGQTIKYLVGTLVPLTQEESADLDLTNRNFSIVVSGRKKNSSIFLGPARFANHDCKANGRLIPKGNDSMEVQAVQNIEVGDEITVSYGNDYFGPNNIDCLCYTCEQLVRNGWDPKESDPSTDLASVAASDEKALSPSPISKKRKRSPESPSQSQAQNRSLRRVKTKPSPSKLQQSWTPPSSSTSDIADLENGSTSQSLEDTIEVAVALERTLSPPFSPSLNDAVTSNTAPSGSVDETGLLIQGRRRKSSSSMQARKKTKLDKMTARLLGNNSHDKLCPPSPTSLPASGTDSENNGSGTDTVGKVTIKLEAVETSKLEDDTDSSLELVTAQPMTSHDSHAAGDLDLPSDSTSSIPIPSAITTITTTELTKIVSHSSDQLSRVSSKILPSIEPTSTTISTSTSITIHPLSDTSRTPGDYLLTRKLLAQPHDRWVQCHNEHCQSFFLQPNGYQTRRECPRCERHSMLYGFSWPKTDPDRRKILERLSSVSSSASNSGSGATVVSGRKLKKGQKASFSAYRRQGKSGKGSWVVGGGDEEERVMDHRVVHRFVLPEDEKVVTRRGLLMQAELARQRGEVFDDDFKKQSSVRLGSIRTDSEGGMADDRGSSTSEHQHLSAMGSDTARRRRSNRIVQDRVYADV